MLDLYRLKRQTYKLCASRIVATTTDIESGTFSSVPGSGDTTEPRSKLSLLFFRFWARVVWSHIITGSYTYQVKFSPNLVKCWTHIARYKAVFDDQCSMRFVASKIVEGRAPVNVEWDPSSTNHLELRSTSTRSTHLWKTIIEVR